MEKALPNHLIEHNRKNALKISSFTAQLNHSMLLDAIYATNDGVSLAPF